MQIQKRSGQIVDFDVQKIITAIFNASKEVGDNIDYLSMQKIVMPIVDAVRGCDDILTVEEIQDLVEDSLMEAGLKKTAKVYILYRAKKNEERAKIWQMTDLQRDILFNKYVFEDEGFEGFVKRVGYKNPEIQKLIKKKRFLPAGRILMGRRLFEHGKKVTYSNCFTPDVKVLTENGYKEITEVKVGEKVLTEDGKFNRVNALLVNDFEGEMFRFYSSSLNDAITATPNHPILTQEGWRTAEEIYNNNKNIRNKKLKFTSILAEVKDVKYPEINVSEVLTRTNFKEEDGYIFSINPTKFYNGAISNHAGGKMFSKAKLTPEILYLLGRYLGDGSISKRKDKDSYGIFQIVFNAEKERDAYDRCKRILEDELGVKVTDNSNKSQNTLVLKVNSEVFGEFVNYLVGAKENKHFPLGFESDLNVLLGFFDADGVVLKNGSAKIALANENLIQEVQSSLRNNGFNTRDYVEKKTTNGHIYYEIYIGKPVALRLIPLLTKRYEDDRHLQSNEEQKTYIYFDKIEKIPYSGKVYNLSVEENHTYVVNGAVVHNCFVQDYVEDDIESIFDAAKKMARTYSYGGGVGINLKKLRPMGSKVNNAAKETTGAVSFMDLFSLTTGLISQKGRRGALMISMPVTHPDIVEFISVKTNLDKVTFANISVMVTDDFMRAVRDGLDWTMTFEVEATGEKIEKTLPAKEIMRMIALVNWRTAEPGMLFWDRVGNYHINDQNPDVEYVTSNPCGEKPLFAWNSCLLGSINLAAYVVGGVFNYEKFAKDVRLGVRYLDEVLGEGVPLLPLEEQREVVAKYRSIGLGLMGLADMFIYLGIKYGGKDSLELSHKIGHVMANAALQESALMAKESGPYPAYDREKVLRSNYLKEVASEETMELIRKYGLRNAELLSIAPTGLVKWPLMTVMS